MRRLFEGGVYCYFLLLSAVLNRGRVLLNINVRYLDKIKNYGYLFLLVLQHIPVIGQSDFLSFPELQEKHSYSATNILYFLRLG